MTEEQARKQLLNEWFSPDDVRVALETTKASITATMKQQSPDETLAETWRKAVAPATDLLAEGIGRFFQTMSQTGTTVGFGAIKEPAGPMHKTVGQGLASIVIPQTPVQGALTALPFAKGFSALPLKGRLALPAVAGAGVGQMSGEGMWSGLAQGAGTGAAVAATGGGIQAGKTIRARLGSVTKEREVAEAAAPGIGDALALDVSAIRGLPHTTSRDLLMLRDPKTGVGQAIRDAFERVDVSIAAAFGDTPMSVPTLAHSQAAMAITKTLSKGKGLPISPNDPLVQRMVSTMPTDLPAKEAGALLKLLKEEARQAPAGPDGFSLRLMARQAEAEYVQSLATQNPGLATQYQEAVKGFDRGLKAIKLLGDVAFARDVKGATLRPEALRKFLTENMEQFSPSDFPALWRSAFPAGAEGAGDVVTKLMGERLFLPSSGPMGVGLSVPAGRAQLIRRPGVPPIQPPYAIPGLVGAGAAAGGAEIAR